VIPSARVLWVVVAERAGSDRVVGVASAAFVVVAASELMRALEPQPATSTTQKNAAMAPRLI
jgi:ABC-type branched-subunit amino acid transport system permease subunit